MSDTWKDALPFFGALVFIFASPLLDELVWRREYVRFYQEGPDSPIAPEDLAKGASWAVDMAQVVPGTVLTWIGIVPVLPDNGVVIAAVSSLISLVPFLFVAWLQGRGDLQHRKYMLGPYPPPQLFLAAVNVVGLAIVFWP